MCMPSATTEGVATDFHIMHYGSRALGGVGLVMTETAAVTPNSPIGPGDLGIWDDAHIPNLRRIVGCRPSGRRADRLRRTATRPPQTECRRSLPDRMGPASASLSNSPKNHRRLPYRCRSRHGGRVRRLRYTPPTASSSTNSAPPCPTSAPTNTAEDHAGHYRIVREVSDAVRTEWNGPLFVRISSTDYVEGGNTPEDFIVFGR